MGRNTWRARDCGRYNCVLCMYFPNSVSVSTDFTPTTYGCLLVVVESPRESKSLTCAKRANPFLRLRCLSRTVSFHHHHHHRRRHLPSLHLSSLHLLLTGIYCLESVFYPHPPLLSIVLFSTASPSPSGIRPPTIDPRFRSVTSCTFDTSLFFKPSTLPAPISFFPGRGRNCFACLHRHVRNDAAGQSTLCIVILPPSPSNPWSESTENREITPPSRYPNLSGWKYKLQREKKGKSLAISAPYRCVSP